MSSMRNIASSVKHGACRACEVLRTKSLRAKYVRTLSRLRGRPAGVTTKVLFLVNETSKWKVQAICDEMKRRGGYEFLIALTIADVDRSLNDVAKAEKMKESAEFFKARGFNVVVAYNVEAHKATELNQYNPDVVFYPHPWGIPVEQLPAKVANRAVTCYVPYFVPTFGNPGMHLGQPVHKEVLRHFVLNEQWADYYKSLYDKPIYAGEIVGLGHPMLDVLAEASEDSGTDGLVIYAPHWSIPHPKLNSFLDLSTFLDNGRFILEYAKQHPEVKWAFKPHPTLRTTLLHIGVMTEAEVEEYYHAWEEIGEACYDGGYVDLFRRSRAMITDCDSFLAEYACTRKPIIHLISPVPNKRKYSPMQKLFDTYYKVHDNNELVKMLDAVVVGREDPNREIRCAELLKSGLIGTNAAKNIVDHIEGLMGVAH